MIPGAALPAATSVSAWRSQGEASESRPVGQWLAEYLETRIPNETFTGSRVEYGQEWFFLSS
jgi:hypothetical protein